MSSFFEIFFIPFDIVSFAFCFKLPRIRYEVRSLVPVSARPFLALIGSLGLSLQGIAGSVMALITLFFPSFLLIGGLLPFWSVLGRLAPMRRALLGNSALVVGILLAALFQPLWQVGIRGGAEFSLELVVCRSFLRRGGWFDPGLIHSSAESLH